MRKVSLLALAMSAIIAPAFAQTLDRQYSLQIERQPLVATLRDLSKQTGLQVIGMMGANAEEDRIVGPLRGEYTAEAALNELLAQSNLVFKRVNARTIAIVGRYAVDRVKSDGAEANSSMWLNGASGTSAAPGQWRAINHTAVTAEETALPGASERQPDFDAAAQIAADAVEQEEVIVTGSHIRGSEPIGSKVLVINREQIETSYGKLQDYIESVPQNFTGISEDFSQTGTSNLTRGTEIQLRGLGAGTTLTLINGQRQAPGGALGAYTDISSIPTSAIERVEILPDGASAIYGSDAIGGVVNIVLRDDLDGIETSVRMGTAGGDADDVQFAQLFGTYWDGGNVLVGYQYSKREALLFGDREYFSSNGDLRAFGGADRRRDAYRGASPGNIVNAAGTVLYAIPGGQDGTALRAADLLPNQTNYFDASSATLQPEQEVHSAFLNASQSLTDRVEMEFGARFAERDSEMVLPGSLTTVSVPSTNPFYVNPAGGTAPVRVEYDFSNDFGGAPRDIGRTKTYAANFATTIALTSDWDVRVLASYGEESVLQMRTNQRDSAALSAALADRNRATALNVFGNGTANNPATIASIRVDRFDETTSTVWSTGLIADGPLFRLNGRDARLAVGADYYDQSYELTSTFEINGQTRSDRKVSSAFAELAIPLLGGGAASGAAGLELSLAGRVDDYDDFGSTSNPKIGLSWQPLEQLKLRGTWGTAFRAPPFYLLNGDIRPSDLSVSTLADPTAPSGRTRVLARFGVMPGLKEETAEVWTAGFDVKPLADLSISLTYFDIAYQDKIQAGAAVTSTILVFEEQFAGTGIIIRNPTPAQLSEVCTPEFAADCAGGPFGALVDFRLRNVSEVNVSGLDLAADYSFKTRLGAIGVGLAGTYTFNYEEAVTEVAAPFDYIDTLGRPLSLRVRGTLGWSLEGWHAATAVSYVGSYDDPTTSRGIGAWTTVDLSAGYEFGTNSGWLRGLRTQFVTTNVFDKRPPFVDRASPFDGANSNITGRTVSLQVVKQW